MYGLTRRRDGLLLYIGVTKDPVSRLAGHKTHGRSKFPDTTGGMCKWMQDNPGDAIDLIVLLTVYGTRTRAESVETEMIARHTLAGCELVNIRVKAGLRLDRWLSSVPKNGTQIPNLVEPCSSLMRARDSVPAVTGRLSGTVLSVQSRGSRPEHVAGRVRLAK